MSSGDDIAAPGTIKRPGESAAWDCPECGVTASVHDDFCDVCFAELDEFRLESPADVHEAAKLRP